VKEREGERPKRCQGNHPLPLNAEQSPASLRAGATLEVKPPDHLLLAQLLLQGITLCGMQYAFGQAVS